MRLIISTEFTESERNRFRNLLELANSSKYNGERENALAAATRIAQKHNMTLDEAARWTPPESADNKPAQRQEFYQHRRGGAAGFDNTGYTEQSTEAEKNRWKAAMESARDRGLDKAEEAKKAAQEAAGVRRSNSKSRRNPIIHANILLKETSFSFEEIADITGLDIYEVVGMKLKARTAA